MTFADELELLATQLTASADAVNALARGYSAARQRQAEDGARALARAIDRKQTPELIKALQKELEAK